jgi:ATP-dependent helicase/nuclease subunit B
MGAQAAIAPQDKEGLEGPFSRQESLRLAAQVWNEEPVDWDALKAALESYPLAGSTSAQTRFHDEIRRRLMSDLIRRHEVKTGAFDGIIGHPELLRAIGEHVGAPGFRYSPKVINTYLSCPFEFFMQCILGLEPAAEIAEELEGRDLGQFAHEILALFHQKISENGMIRVTPGNRIQSLELMGEIANGYLSEKPYFQRNSMDAWSVRERLTRGLVFQDTDKEEIERIKKGVDVSRNRRGMLRALIDHEADLDARLKPVRTEFGFGFSGSRTLEIIDRDRVIRVVGRIDRIDHYDGPAENGETVWVYDYKTGKAPTLGSVKNGLDLQLQIYLMAILDLYEDVRPASVGGCFLELNPSNEDLRRVVIYTPQVPPDLLNGVGRSSLEMGPDKIESCREIIRHIDRSIRNGAFPRAKNRANCHNCRYGFVCYRDEYKVGRLWEGSVQDHMDYI